jgi:LPXTG-site transpeptidase (sortase) family protein
MKQKNKSGRMLSVTILSGLVLFSGLLFYFFSRDSVQNVSAMLVKNIVVPLKQKQAIPVQIVSGSVISVVGQPVNISIPSIKVNAKIVSVGLTSGGAMDVPKGPTEVAWFNLGPRPGDIGSAVFSGHYGWKNNIPAVFDNISKLRKGDKVYIKDDKGKIITFIVRKSVTYDQNANASAVFTSTDGKAHLNLVTCSGIWNKNQKSYSTRLVVFADRE